MAAFNADLQGWRLWLAEPLKGPSFIGLAVREKLGKKVWRRGPQKEGMRKAPGGTASLEGRLPKQRRGRTDGSQADSPPEVIEE